MWIIAHLDVELLSHSSKCLQVKLLLIGFLGMRVQSVHESLCSAVLTHARAKLRAPKVQIPQAVRVRIGQTVPRQEGVTKHEHRNKIYNTSSEQSNTIHCHINISVGFIDRYLRFMISTTSSASLLVAVSLSSKRALACKKKKKKNHTIDPSYFSRHLRLQQIFSRSHLSQSY